MPKKNTRRIYIITIAYDFVFDFFVRKINIFLSVVGTAAVRSDRVVICFVLFLRGFVQREKATNQPPNYTTIFMDVQKKSHNAQKPYTVFTSRAVRGGRAMQSP